MPAIHRITPCLWFNDQAEAAVAHYTSIFRNSRVLSMLRYSEAGREIHGKEPGTVMTIDFELEGLRFTALNGGPMFRFTEAISLQVHCDTQEEVDYYWDRLTEGGDPAAQQCGWLKDRFGLSWQVVPRALIEMLQDPDASRSQRTMLALLQMTRIDIARLREAHAG